MIPSDKCILFPKKTATYQGFETVYINPTLFVVLSINRYRRSSTLLSSNLFPIDRKLRGQRRFRMARRYWTMAEVHSYSEHEPLETIIISLYLHSEKNSLKRSSTRNCR